MRIFLSYAREDYHHAKKLYDKLIAFQMVDVWFDKESLSPGQKWELEIGKAIRSSRFFLLLLSKQSTSKKGFYQREIREALKVLEEYPDYEIFLVPIRIDDCKLQFERLNALQYVDLFPDWEAGFQKVFKVITSDHNSQTTFGGWRLKYVEGSSLELIDGIAGTRQSPNGHHRSLFPLDATAILGDSNKKPPFNESDHTIASWTIPIEEISSDSFTRCFLVFGCMRHFGGLHSPVANDFVEIELNGYPVDGFEVRIIPPGQTDYFHQRKYADIPKPYPFSMCENLYAWPIPNSHIGEENSTKVLVRIAKRTKWDIDYVGLMFQLDNPPAGT